MSEIGSDPESTPNEGSFTPVRLRREHTAPSVTLQFQLDEDGSAPSSTTAAYVPRRSSGRPRSASYVALRSAVYQITSLSDFTREKIGSGFFADVYKVKHKTTGEVMVLKMNKCRTNSRKMLSEIQLMNRLSHPNILKFRGSCVHEGQLHALTEYINGGSLGTWLHNTKIELSWSQRVKIAKDIARGMAYLHSKGVFHRDLNSSNCLIQKHPGGRLRTVVADFGLAAQIKQRRRRSHTEVVGSPYWMAPECLRGQSYCEQADVFSFGITLAEIMARVPADPEYMPRTKQFGMDCEALREMCPDCPEELFDLTNRCCQLDPDDRPTFEEIVQVLESIHLHDDDASDDEEEHSQEHSQAEQKVQNSTQGTNHLQQHPAAQSPTANPMDLRGCISEPFLRLQDSLEDLSSSSELVLHSRLDSTSSLATSTEASSSSGGSTGSGHGGIIEEEECEFSLIHETKTVPRGPGPLLGHSGDEDGTENDDVVVPAFAREGVREIRQLESRKTILSEAAQQPVSSETVVESSRCTQNSSESGEVVSDAKMLSRRSSEGDLKFNHLSSSNQDRDRTPSSKQRPSNRKLRNPLIKSISLNTANESSLLPPGRHLGTKIINSSVQTLVGDEPDDLKVDNLGGGGDSGIDPGEAEVFKFPPKIELSNGLSDRSSKRNGVVIEPAVIVVEDGQLNYAQNGPVSDSCGGVDLSVEEGDLTPLCASPTFVPAAKSVASQTPHVIQGERRSSLIVEVEEGEPLLVSTPNHLGSSLGGSGNVHDPFVTPYRRSSSPNAQSCASSEFSFYLPSPSFPWAPPSSPIGQQMHSRSLPATPTRTTPTSVARNHFRYSQEITSNRLSSAAVYPLSYMSESSIMSGENPSKMDHKMANGNFSDNSNRNSLQYHAPGKTVHFLPEDIDRDLCKQLDDDFSSTSLIGDSSYKLSHRRSRSQSNPAHMITQQSAHYSLTYARSPPTTPTKGHDPERVTVRTRTSHKQLKCYNIRLRRGVRLSNSVPNLPSMFSLHSPVL